MVARPTAIPSCSAPIPTPTEAAGVGDSASATVTPCCVAVRVELGDGVPLEEGEPAAVAPAVGAAGVWLGACTAGDGRPAVGVAPTSTIRAVGSPPA